MTPARSLSLTQERSSDLKADETTTDGKKVHQMPAFNYEQAFGEVLKVVDAHPELWERSSRDAMTLLSIHLEAARLANVVHLLASIFLGSFRWHLRTPAQSGLHRLPLTIAPMENRL
jgi:hypothetical protein